MAEWGDYYVRYEKLKQILKKCKEHFKRFSDLANRDPALAKSIKELFKAGRLTPVSSIESIREEKRRISRENVVAGTLASSPLSEEGEGNNNQLDTTNETTSLLGGGGGVSPNGKTTILGYGGQIHHAFEQQSPLRPGVSLATQQQQQQQHGDSGSRNMPLDNSSHHKIKDVSKSEHSESSVGSNFTQALRRAASGVTEYFSSPLERQMKDSLLQYQKHSKEFEQVLVKDIEMVNEFYSEKLKEVQDRLDFLKETAAEGLGLTPRQLAGQINEEGPNHRRSRTPIEFAKSLVRLPLRSSERVPIGLDFDDDEEDVEFVGGGDANKEMDSSKRTEVKAQRIREAESIQRALVDQYRTAKLLHNYAILNFTGFVKIVKKHDKGIPEEKGKYKQAIRPTEICNEGKAIEEHAALLERLYASWFCGGNRSEARAQLLPKKGDSLEMDWSQFRLGYRLGMCTILGLWVCWDCFWGFVSEGSSTIGERAAFPVFRACGGLLTLQWFWGMSAWVWSRYRINYIYLFDFDPRIVASPLKIFNEAVDNTIVFLTCTLLYYKAGVHDIPGDTLPAGIFPFLLVMYTLLQLLWPVKTRIPMWLSIWKLITTPTSSPSFFDGYVGDIFTSMVKVFQDIVWTSFFILSGDWLVSEDLKASGKHKWAHTNLYKHYLIPLVTLIPLWFRFSQCLRRYADTGDRFPHLPNALKYAVSQTVTMFGAFHPLYLDLNSNRESDVFQLFWMFAFIGSSLYSFGWDVYMDWGLGRRKYAFLGPRLMFPRKGAYYAIIAVDFVLRFAWVLTLIPPHTGAKFAIPDYLTAVSMVLELWRRTLWGFLRLENEHRSNTAGYRRVDFVPLHFATGHMHEYTQEKQHRGFSVLLEVAIITLVVVMVSFGSVIAAQHATERSSTEL